MQRVRSFLVVNVINFSHIKSTGDLKAVNSISTWVSLNLVQLCFTRTQQFRTISINKLKTNVASTYLRLCMCHICHFYVGTCVCVRATELCCTNVTCAVTMQHSTALQFVWPMAQQKKRNQQNWQRNETGAFSGYPCDMLGRLNSLAGCLCVACRPPCRQQFDN